VLVRTGELAEDKKWAIFVPSLVRLQFLNECFRVWMNAPNHAFEFLQGLRVIREENRELRVSGHAPGEWSSLMREGEFVGEVVQGRAEVVETIAKDEANSVGRRLEHFGPD
jgi:hypothetical protein